LGKIRAIRGPPRVSTPCASCSRWVAECAKDTRGIFWTPGGPPRRRAECFSHRTSNLCTGGPPRLCRCGQVLGAINVRRRHESSMIPIASLRAPHAESGSASNEHESCGNATPCPRGWQLYWDAPRCCSASRTVFGNASTTSRPARPASTTAEQHPSPPVFPWSPGRCCGPSLFRARSSLPRPSLPDPRRGGLAAHSGPRRARHLGRAHSVTFGCAPRSLSQSLRNAVPRKRSEFQ